MEKSKGKGEWKKIASKKKLKNHAHLYTKPLKNFMIVINHIVALNSYGK
jgi:hypothetical protein